MNILRSLPRLFGFSRQAARECPNCGSQEVRISRIPAPGYTSWAVSRGTDVKIAMQAIFGGSCYPKKYFMITMVSDGFFALERSFWSEPRRADVLIVHYKDLMANLFRRDEADR